MTAAGWAHLDTLHHDPELFFLPEIELAVMHAVAVQLCGWARLKSHVRSTTFALPLWSSGILVAKPVAHFISRY